MTDTTAPRYKTCDRCYASVRNIPKYLEAHIDYHAEEDERYAEIRQSVVYLGREHDTIRTTLRTTVPATADDPDETFGSTDDEELDDPEAADDPDSDTVGDALAAFTPTVPAPTINPIA